jgi:hypothetical protein
MNAPRHVVGGPNDLFKRLDEGLCALYPCPGRLLLHDAETKYALCPEWINEHNVKNGYPPCTEPVEVTTYTYRCLECGHEVVSTKFLDTALMN